MKLISGLLFVKLRSFTSPRMSTSLGRLRCLGYGGCQKVSAAQALLSTLSETVFHMPVVLVATRRRPAIIASTTRARISEYSTADAPRRSPISFPSLAIGVYPPLAPDGIRPFSLMEP